MNLDLKPSITWTAEQRAYLRTWYGIKSDEAIASAIGKTHSSIAAQARALRVTKAENRARQAAAPAPNQPGTLGRARKMPRAPGLHGIMATATPYGPAPESTSTAPSALPMPVRNSTTQGYYSGHELAPYQGRPGAMDAFTLPSRRFDRREYRDGRVEVVA
jgi:hypothetical protein